MEHKVDIYTAIQDAVLTLTMKTGRAPTQINLGQRAAALLLEEITKNYPLFPISIGMPKTMELWGIPVHIDYSEGQQDIVEAVFSVYTDIKNYMKPEKEDE